MVAVLWPFSGQQFNDVNGKPLVGARAYFYDGGTTTPLASGPWQDLGLSSPSENPVVSNGLGMFPVIFLDSESVTYGLRVTDAAGVQVFAAETLPIGGGGEGGGDIIISGGDYETGDLKPSFNTGNKTGWVRANGRTIGNSASGATERAADNTQPLFELLWAKNSDLFPVTPGGRGSTAADDFAANKAIALPDARGRAIVGANNMGGGSSARLSGDKVTSVGGGGSGPDIPGSYGGVEEIVLTTAQLAAHDHVATLTSAEIGITGGINSGGTHKHDFTFSDTSNAGAIGGSGNKQLTGVDKTYETANGGAHTHTHDIAATLDELVLDIGDRGQGEAHNNMPPFVLVTYYIKL